MNKRKVLTRLLLLVLVAAVAVGSTLAYFTSRDDEINTFTMGKVEIDLKESNDGEKFFDDGIEYNGVLPGDTKTKIARVTVGEESADCYIMVTAKVAVPEGSTFTEENIAALYTAIEDAVDPDYWTVTVNSDGTLKCVYNEICNAESEAVLFNEISIPTSFGNNTAGQSFEIILKAYAIQAANLELEDVDWANEFAAVEE